MHSLTFIAFVVFRKIVRHRISSVSSTTKECLTLQRLQCGKIIAFKVSAMDRWTPQHWWLHASTFSDRSRSEAQSLVFSAACSSGKWETDDDTTRSCYWDYPIKSVFFFKSLMKTTEPHTFCTPFCASIVIVQSTCMTQIQKWTISTNTYCKRKHAASFETREICGVARDSSNHHQAPVESKAATKQLTVTLILNLPWMVTVTLS